ncbi:GPI-anchored protein LLG1-like [Rhodamnia argentea]|uniref:GPI-anchored protein LLG1-like n=1 Tax=Rhodamnia argentea TaxID=178133 RepID=A0A8B8QRC2_9MYRT|nr:GPI-anchored protein LLG1-like [Rhodamnia argentea]
MAPFGFSLCKLFALFLILLTCSSKAAPLPTPISDDVFESQALLAGRHLLQAKQGCPVNFEFLNYTIIMSKCKGPTYPPKVCCAAFKEFACPYADVINDLTNDCASTMFSYINLYGKYPPGLFAAECREGKLGLECPALPPSSLANDSSGAQITCHAPILLVLSVGFVILVFQVLFGPRL